MERSGILSLDSAPGERHVQDYNRIRKIVEATHAFGGKVVLTSGSFDLVHIGHARYLREARLLGDLLIVGVESDERVQKRKGPTRPIVPQDERVEALTHLRYVDVVVVKKVQDRRWRLIRTVRPDILVISKRTGYSDQKIEELKEFCGEIVNLPSQAETSTSARLREMQVGVIGPAVKSMEGAMNVLDSGIKKLKGI